MENLNKVIAGLECCLDEERDCKSNCPYYRDEMGCMDDLLVAALEVLKSVEPVVHAHWTFYEDEQGDWWDKCPVCGWKNPNIGGYPPDIPRCPECGAHMDEEVVDG